MKLSFEPITLDKQSEYRGFLAKCERRTSDYSFLNLWGWSGIYDLEWAWEENLVWIRQKTPEPCFWGPVGHWSGIDWPLRFQKFGRTTLEYIRVPDTLSDIWKEQLGNRVQVKETREHHDYLYSARELIELKGNRFHKKKNLYSQFIRNYSVEYRPIGPDMLSQVRDMQNDWCTWRNCEAQDTLSGENLVIDRLLANWENLNGIMGGSIWVEGVLAAYTVGEMLDDETVVIHFEKGSTEFKGIYQAINRMFLVHSGAGIRWVNREQDLGDEGLRKAKLSYHPVELLRKNRVVIDNG
jgi:hypothetical protein